MTDPIMPSIYTDNIFYGMEMNYGEHDGTGDGSGIDHLAGNGGYYWLYWRKKNADMAINLRPSSSWPQ